MIEEFYWSVENNTYQEYIGKFKIYVYNLNNNNRCDINYILEDLTNYITYFKLMMII